MKEKPCAFVKCEGIISSHESNLLDNVANWAFPITSKIYHLSFSI